MPVALAVAVFGACGALGRYGLDVFIARQHPSFPWSTFVANLSGSFAIGLLFALTSERVELAPWIRLGLTAGLLGGFTTFSALSLQTFRFLETGRVGMAAANAAGSLFAGLAAAALGVALGRAI